MSADEAHIVYLLESLLRPRIGFVPDPWPEQLRRVIRELAAERDVSPEVMLRSADRAAALALTRAATTVHTRFNRHPDHLVRFGAELTKMGRPARIWSAGCATGEEPYSIALVARELGVMVSILATDVNDAALERAERGVYPGAYVRRAGIEAPDKEWTVPETVRRSVRFELASIAGANPTCGSPPFDFVFCRNVLIHFDGPTADRMIGQLLRHVRRNGALVLAPVEVLRALPPGATRSDPLGWLDYMVSPPPSVRAPVPAPAPEPTHHNLDFAARALGSGALDVAEDELRDVLANHPEYGEGWFLLGEVLAKRGEEAQAAVAFLKAAEHTSRDEEGETLAKAARRRAQKFSDPSG